MKIQISLLATVFCLSLFALTSSAEDQVIQKSAWTKINFAIKGEVTLVEKDGSVSLVLDDKFKTKNAPDLKLFLSPLSVSDITNENATKGTILIALLKKNKKAQSYLLPKGTDLSAFKSVLLHCEKYSKAWGAFDLK